MSKSHTAILIVMALEWVYVQYGAMPQAEALAWNREKSWCAPRPILAGRPCSSVVGVRNGTTRLKAGQRVRVDGNTGRVTPLD